MMELRRGVVLGAVLGVCCWVSGGEEVKESKVLEIFATISLWPAEKMPGRGPNGKERELPSKGDNVIRITDVHEPAIAVYKASAKTPTPAIVVCPGGGYGALAYNKEGTEIAAWLNSIGITAIVLKYRVPSNQDGAFQDIQRAMRIVRKNAGEWNVAPNSIGVMGFSAGGHLCARLSTNADEATYAKLDGIDDEKIRPDFAILIYPAYLSQGEKLSKQLPVSEKTPPTFMVHTEDDKSFVVGSKVYHAALEAAKVPNEYFLCAEGGHGYGLRSKKEVGVWPVKCEAWLGKSGILKAEK